MIWNDCLQQFPLSEDGSRETINHRLDWATRRTLTILFEQVSQLYKSTEQFSSQAVKVANIFLQENILIQQENCHINMSTGWLHFQEAGLGQFVSLDGLWQVNDFSLPPFLSTHRACASLPAIYVFPRLGQTVLVHFQLRRSVQSTSEKLIWQQQKTYVLMEREYAIR